MPSTIKKLPKSQMELTLTIDGKKLALAYEEEYKKQSKEVTIKGFRPGKAPRHLIEDRLGREQLFQDAMNELLFEAYRDAIKEHKLTPIAYPEFKVEKMEEGKDIEVKAIVSVRPDATLGDYKKIKAKKETVKEATEDEIKELIEASYQSWKAQLNASTSSAQAKIETATSLKEAETKAEETKPQGDDFIDISKLGKDSFEEFLKANQVKTKDELHVKVKETLQEQKEMQAEKEYINKLLDKLLEITKVEIPEALIEQELAEMEKNMEAQFKPLGLELDDYLKHNKKDRESLKKEWRPQAEKNIKLEFSLSALAEKENIVITEEEVEETIKTVPDEKIRKELEKPHQKVYIKYNLQREKTLKKLQEIAEK